jgi:hypothetical protein
MATPAQPEYRWTLRLEGGRIIGVRRRLNELPDERTPADRPERPADEGPDSDDAAA